MATNTINLGSSSIDVAGIVKGLSDNKRKATDKALGNLDSANKTKISAVGNFTSSLTNLQNAIKSLADGSVFKAHKTTVSEASVLSAVAEPDARSNTYTIVVDKLATAQKTTSAAFAGGKEPMGTGTLTIAIGDKSIDLDIKPPTNTLENIRDLINKAPGNPGVTASIVTGTDGAHLTLTSTSTGKRNAFTVSASGDAALTQLAFDPATGSATVTAQDAEFTIDNTKASSPTNTVASAIDGVTLTLTKAGTSTVVIQDDTSAVATALNSLVTAYNQFISQYQTLTKYDKTNQQVGALIGDATVTSIKSQVSALLGSQSTGSASGPRSLSDLGVAFQLSGTLKFDATKLTKALAISPAETQDVLSGTNGVAVKLDKMIAGWTSTTGILSQRAANLNARAKDIVKKSADFEVSMKSFVDRITKQYTALDTMMTKLGSTSSYLQQQFDALSKKG
ncbi:MAG TPA: flagellar filament capping protein FliD [Luteibacter sp.]|uniref:flagellar filament capping protein FliD n=1 Tax=Luteibacter sp. TaxID=1886636 RepID=UPI002C460313|nr:flagellar filament capping protein FliD [Luteibacter sp.]HVI53821.1 flagellar filament capping protein FliD [Luteibacter sp.]